MTPLALLPLLLVPALPQPPQRPTVGAPVLERADFTPDGRTVLVRFLTVSTAMHTHHSSLYDIATGRRLAGPAVTAPRRDWTAEALHPDGAVLLVSRPAGSKDARELVLWDWRIGRELRMFDPPVTELESAAFTPDGRLVVTSHCDNRVGVWDVETGKPAGELDRPRKPLSPPSREPVLFLPGDSRRVVMAEPGGLAAWDLASGRRLARVSLPDFPRSDLAACGADGATAVTVYTGIGPDETGAWVWDLGAGRLRHALAFPEGYVVAAAITPTGNVLAASGRGVVRAWDPRGRPLWRAPVGKPKGIRPAAFSPGGRYLLTGGDQTTLLLWDTQRRRVVWTAEEKP